MSDVWIQYLFNWNRTDLDLKLIQIRNNNRTVCKDGQHKDKIGQEYGHNIFEIYSVYLLVAEVGHFRRNNWYTNQCAFDISKKGQILL